MSINWSVVRKHPALTPSFLVISLVCAGIIYEGMTGRLTWIPGQASGTGAEVKSVAYYVANIKVAKEVNRACYDTGSDDVPEKQECENALKALELAHVGQNYQN